MGKDTSVRSTLPWEISLGAALPSFANGRKVSPSLSFIRNMISSVSTAPGHVHLWSHQDFQWVWTGHILKYIPPSAGGKQPPPHTVFWLSQETAGYSNPNCGHTGVNNKAPSSLIYTKPGFLLALHGKAFSNSHAKTVLRLQSFSGDLTCVVELLRPGLAGNTC